MNIRNNVNKNKLNVNLMLKKDKPLKRGNDFSAKGLVFLGIVLLIFIAILLAVSVSLYIWLNSNT